MIHKIISPFDAHLHLRDGELLNSVVNYTAEMFAAALVMPNLDPPVVTVKQAHDYRQRILKNLGKANEHFCPYMTLYLTEETDRLDIRIGFKEGIIVAAKLYPPQATTNSAHGVANLEKIYPVLETMAEVGMPLCVHGEMPPNSGLDIFDREKIFLLEKLHPLLIRFPKLKIVVEHVTTKDACDFVISHDLQATITPQHLLFDRNALFAGGLQPDMYCLPILKRDSHKKRIQEVVIAGDKHFGLGTDSAPHLRNNKYKACGCAGVFNAPVALEAYFSFFADNKIEDKFQAFASDNMAKFYELDLPKLEVVFEKKDWLVPEDCGNLTSLFAGQTMKWRAVR